MYDSGFGRGEHRFKLFEWFWKSTQLLFRCLESSHHNRNRKFTTLIYLNDEKWWHLTIFIFQRFISMNLLINSETSLIDAWAYNSLSCHHIAIEHSIFNAFLLFFVQNFISLKLIKNEQTNKTEYQIECVHLVTNQRHQFNSIIPNDCIRKCLMNFWYIRKIKTNHKMFLLCVCMCFQTLWFHLLFWFISFSVDVSHVTLRRASHQSVCLYYLIRVNKNRFRLKS